MLQVVNLASKEALKVIAIVEFRPKCRQCSPLEVKIRLQGAQVSKANYFRKKKDNKYNKVSKSTDLSKFLKRRLLTM